MIILEGRERKMKKRDEVAEEIKTALENVPGIQYAFIYDSFANNSEDHGSEVDIMVFGGPDLVEMDGVITEAEGRLERPLVITSFTLREVQERIKVKDKAILKDLKGPKIMLLGDEEEMKTILGEV